MIRYLQNLFAASNMTLKGIGLGLLCGILTWTVLDAYQAHRLEQVLRERSEERLREEASSNRMIFHRYLKQHVQLTKLFAAYQPLVRWLEQRRDRTSGKPFTLYEKERPDWFPPLSTWRGLIDPGHFLLRDAEGQLHAMYRLAKHDLPLDGVLAQALSSGRSEGQIFLLTLEEHPYLVTSAPINSPQGRKLGNLTTVSRIDDEFIRKLNYATDAPNVILGLFEGAEGRLVASSQPERLGAGISWDQLQKDYFATGKPFFDYGASELMLRLVTLIPLDKVSALNATILHEERNQHIVAAVAFTLSFTLLIFSWSRRIESVLKQIHSFSRNISGVARDLRIRGDVLWQLERDFIQLRDEIYAARESVRQQQNQIQRLKQLELLESVADHLGLGVLLLGPEGDVELKTQRVERFEATLGEGWYDACLQPGGQENKLELEDALQQRYSFNVNRLTLFNTNDIVVIHDITEHESLRRRLREQQVQFHRITQSARDAIISSDKMGNVVHWNKAAQAMFQYSALEILRQPVTRLMPESYRDAHRTALDRAVGIQDSRTVGHIMELEGLSKDGTIFPLELSLSRFKTKNETYFTAIIRDITDRKRALKALQESEARFFLFMDHLPAAVFIKAPHDRLYFVNEYLKSHFGTGDDRRAKAAVDFPVEAIDQFGHHDDMVLAEGWYEIVKPLEDNTGRERTFRIHNFSIPQPNGEQPLIGGIAWDITDAVAASEALRHSEHRYREIFETAEEGIWLVDPAGNTIEVNERMASMLGYSDYEMRGRNQDEFIDGKARTELANLFDPMRKEVANKFDLRLRTKSEAEIWTMISTTPIHDAKGNYTGSLRMVTDITERKRAEETLKQERDFADSLIETAPVIVMVLDPQGYVMRFNSFMQNLSGYSLAEVKDTSCVDTFLAERDREQVTEDLVKVKEGVPISGNLNAMVTRDGTERLISWYARALRDSSGEVIALLVIGHDVTEEKAQEAQLHQAQKMQVVGQLTGGVAHDFNNLLTIILGNLKLLAAAIEPDCDPETMELLEDSTSAAQDGAELTQRLLVFSQKTPLQKKRIYLPVWLKNFQRFLERTLSSDIEVRLNNEADLEYFLCDPSELQSAMLNLALNARDAMPNGGLLVLRAALEEVPQRRLTLLPGIYVKLMVIDSGEGMTPDQLNQAIEPFYTTKGSKQGSGLGLSTVFRFCEQAGGLFKLESEPEAGTQAMIWLPVNGSYSDEPVRMDESMSPAPSTDAHGTILVVEDDERILKLAKRFLTDLGYDVLLAEDGESALTILQSESAIDLVFSDIVMPGRINGDDLYRWVAEQRPEVKVLLTTGLSSEKLKKLTGDKEAQIPLPLPKPYTKEQLAEAIRGVSAV